MKSSCDSQRSVGIVKLIEFLLLILSLFCKVVAGPSESPKPAPAPGTPTLLNVKPGVSVPRIC